MLGAPQSDNNCAKCHKVVANDALTCDVCSSLMHYSCFGISNKLFKELKSADSKMTMALCNSCRLSLDEFTKTFTTRFDPIECVESSPRSSDAGNNSISDSGGSDSWDSQLSRDLENNNVVIIGPDQIIDSMRHITDNVSSIINVSSTSLRLLFPHFNWDEQNLIDFYFQCGEAGLLRKADLTVQSSALKDHERSDTETYQCESCGEMHSWAIVYGLSCGHYFCLPYWQQYLESKITREINSDWIACPSTDCSVIVDDDVVLNMIQSPTVRRRYEHIMSMSYARNNRFVTLCPGVDCGHARCFNQKKYRCKTNCTNCGELFCSVCGQRWDNAITHDQHQCSLEYDRIG